MIKKILIFYKILFIVIVSECNEGELFTNQTPKNVPENSSKTYTISAYHKIEKVFQNKNNLSQEFEIVINNESYSMNRNNADKRSYDYEFRMPLDQKEVRYFYTLKNSKRFKDGMKTRKYNSRIYSMKVFNQYVVTLQSHRGISGQNVFIIGRGFHHEDKIIFGKREVGTEFVSDFSLKFIVPKISTNKIYPVFLKRENQIIEIGDFLVDVFQLPPSLNILFLKSNESGFVRLLFLPSQGTKSSIFGVCTNASKSLTMECEFITSRKSKEIVLPYSIIKKCNGLVFFKTPKFKKIVLPIVVY